MGTCADTVVQRAGCVVVQSLLLSTKMGRTDVTKLLGIPGRSQAGPRGPFRVVKDEPLRPPKRPGPKSDQVRDSVGDPRFYRDGKLLHQQSMGKDSPGPQYNPVLATSQAGVMFSPRNPGTYPRDVLESQGAQLSAGGFRDISEMKTRKHKKGMSAQHAAAARHFPVHEFSTHRH